MESSTKPELNRPLVERLLAHYKAMGPEQAARMRWGWGDCAGGVLIGWKLVPDYSRQVNDVAAVLGLEYQQAYRMVYRTDKNGGDLVLPSANQTVHSQAVAMLENLLATGDVAWPDSNGVLR